MRNGWLIILKSNKQPTNGIFDEEEEEIQNY